MLRIALISEHASPLALAGGVECGGQDIYVRVIHVPAGPARYIPKEELLPHMDSFGTFLMDHFTSGEGYDLVLAHQTSCRPCLHAVCPYDHECATAIEPATVLAAVRELLEDYRHAA